MAKTVALGRKIRKLRTDRNLSQKDLAGRLGISASYLNLIEHDQRPITVSLLLKIGKQFGIDVEELTGDDTDRMTIALREVFSDSILSGHEVSREQMQEIALTAPDASKAIVELYRAYISAREDAQSLVPGLGSGGNGLGSAGFAVNRLAGGRRLLLPAEEARDFFHDSTNYFEALEAAAADLWADALLRPAELTRGLVDHLATRHGVRVDVVRHDEMGGALRRYDTAARRLVLAETLPHASRNFQMAFQIGLLQAKEAVEEIIAKADLSSQEAGNLVRVGLANYFAGAVLMPYDRFLEAARDVRHDIDLLGHRFGVGFEQACHRLSTLQKPGAKGIPFYFVRLDIAGNVSKRFSAAGFHFSRFGGSCPRWIVHEAFTTPGMIRTQIASLPDGATFFCLARTVEKAPGGFGVPHSHMAIGLGCDVAHIRDIVYADGMGRNDSSHGNGQAAEIGPGCRVCDRMDCRQRAFPPLHHRLLVDDKVKSMSPYSFVVEDSEDPDDVLEEA